MRAMTPLTTTSLLLGLAVLVSQPPADAQLTPRSRADLVLSLLPAAAQHDATIVFRDGDAEEVYREGNGPFLCVSDVSSSDRISMVCHHHVLEARLRFERALRRETGLSGGAFRERLCEEVVGSSLDVPIGSMEITASLARDEGGSYEDEMTVYHLLWVPEATSATLGVPDEDPGDGRPFLHQASTCGAHVMWSKPVAVN